VLYISDRHVPGIDTTGVVDIYQERMSIRSADQELLPEWAKFVRGVIDSPDLQPTAARDNLIKDGAYHRLRDALGRLIIDALLQLSRDDPKKFLRLCEWHHYHLKGMAVHDEGFYAAVIDHLPFETNQGALTLPQIVLKQPQGQPGQRIPLYYFSYGLDSNQFNELCEARGLIAINTGRHFDETLVRRYAGGHEKTVELRPLDSFDSPDLYAHLEPDEAQRYYPLESALRRALDPALRQNLRRHIRNSDGYIADIGEHSPNVMMELGWVFLEPDFERRPSLVLRALDQKAPPVDLAGHIHKTYSSLTSDHLAEELRPAIERHEGLQGLREARRARFLTPALLAEAYLHPDVVRIVCDAWDTMEGFLVGDAAEFARRLQTAGHPRLASQFQAVRDALQAL